MLLLDTNIVSYFLHEGSWKDPYVPILQGKDLYIAFMTLAELLEGARHRGLNERNIFEFRKRLYAEYTVVPWNEEICDRFAVIRAGRRHRPISVPDALIAATAIAYDLPLVTHNARDFMEIEGLQLLTRHEV